MQRASLLLAAILTAAPSFAHHSFASEYDGKRPVAVNGVVTDIDWRNPHVYLTVDAKDEAGKVTKMIVEGHPPNILRRTGWTKESLKVGDSISITGWASRDGTARMAGREVSWHDGRKLFLGPPSQ